MSYRLELTESDMSDIWFIGHRYGWSDSLVKYCHVGINEIPEHVAWEISNAIESDTEGGHSYFPMLDGRSELAEKLYKFIESIV